MSILRDGNHIVFECDGILNDAKKTPCTETLETGESDFEDANLKRKAEGWRTTKRGSEWINLCPSCYGNPVKPNLSKLLGKPT